MDGAAPGDPGAVLPRSFFRREPPVVARDLLGRHLFSGVDTDTGAAAVVLRITEVEAYAGESDPASHAGRGRTPRNAVMYGDGGYLYRYLIYGMYWCCNVVTGPEGPAGAVLLRAGSVLSGVDTAHRRRPRAQREAELAAGPAKLTSVLGWGERDSGPRSGEDLCRADSPARILPAGR